MRARIKNAVATPVKLFTGIDLGKKENKDDSSYEPEYPEDYYGEYTPPSARVDDKKEALVISEMQSSAKALSSLGVKKEGHFVPHPPTYPAPARKPEAPTYPDEYKHLQYISKKQMLQEVQSLIIKAFSPHTFGNDDKFKYALISHLFYAILKGASLAEIMTAGMLSEEDALFKGAMNQLLSEASLPKHNLVWLYNEKGFITATEDMRSLDKLILIPKGKEITLSVRLSQLKEEWENRPKKEASKALTKQVTPPVEVDFLTGTTTGLEKSSLSKPSLIG